MHAALSKWGWQHSRLWWTQISFGCAAAHCAEQCPEQLLRHSFGQLTAMLDGYLKVLRNTIFGFKHHRDKAELPITLLQIMEFPITKCKYHSIEDMQESLSVVTAPTRPPYCSFLTISGLYFLTTIFLYFTKLKFRPSFWGVEQIQISVGSKFRTQNTNM